MIRRIIHIDEEKCNGCGACAADLPRERKSEWLTAKRSFLRERLLRRTW